MNNLAYKFANSLKEQGKLHPEWALPTPKGRPPGHTESIRVEFFQSQGMFDPWTLMAGKPWSSLVGTVYSGGLYPPIMVVLAHYSKDGAILWLDNHVNDSDFQLFTHREQLFHWLPDRIDELLTILIETKLSYMGLPVIINMAEDIHGFPKQLSLQEAHEGWVTEIKKPVCNFRNDGMFQLEFYVWTKVSGRVVKIETIWGSNYFGCRGFQLAENIGDRAILR